MVFGMPLSVLLFSSGALLLAGFIKGFIGLGLPTTATGLLTMVMTPGQAAALLVVPNAATNIWQALTGKHLHPLWRRFWPMLLGIGVGSAPGAGFLVHDSSGRAAMALGIMLSLYALFSLLSPRLSVPPQAEWWLAPLAGALTGWLSVLTGVFAIPLVPYLNALSLERDELIQALGLSLLTSAAAVAVALAREGALPVSLLGASLAAFAPAGLGALLGQRLRRRTHPAIFVRFFLVGLLAIGLHLAVRNLI
ncbi:MAG TPA: sulfite exporter TauE/SafE family protein [Xanthobacteraceae bacterium]|nr:sulfite exporter TauE/SafE family protein [Xanthobacteraceae bacterium]